ncbi:MAG: twin-arginine translocase TatA/TatE family subunit [Dehalococcoidia bacterium]
MSFGPVEAIVIVVVVLVLFGAGRLAGVGKALGTGLREFRQEARKAGEDDADVVDTVDTVDTTASAATTQESTKDQS